MPRGFSESRDKPAPTVKTKAGCMGCFDRMPRGLPRGSLRPWGLAQRQDDIHVRSRYWILRYTQP